MIDDVNYDVDDDDDDDDCQFTLIFSSSFN